MATTYNFPKTSIFMYRIPFTTTPKLPSTLHQGLNLFNLIMTGLAGTTFVVMVMSGILIGDVTGTAAFISFLLAAFVSIFPGVCIVEFATRMPSAGSVYTYTYASVGESIAFLIGWNNFWDFVFQAALAAKSMSDLIDRMSDGTIRHFFVHNIGRFQDRPPTDVSGHLFDDSPDLLAALLLLLVCIVLVFSVEISVTTFNIMASFFLGGFLMIVICCFVYGKPDNLIGAQAGPFLIHGYSGIFKGASITLFAFVFYETISVASEEAKAPQRDVPRASLISFVIVTVFLPLASLAISYLQPRYLMDIDSPFISGFKHLKVKWLIWFTFGISILALVTNCLATLYAGSRYLYAMGRDGILPKIFAHLHRRFQSPILAMAVGTLFAIVLAVFFNIVAISKMSQIGSVLSFFIIGVDLIVVRYMPLYAPNPTIAIQQGLQFKQCFLRFFPNEEGRPQSWLRKPMFFSILLLSEIFSIFFASIVFTMYSITRKEDILWTTGGIATGIGLVIFMIMCMYKPNPLLEEESKPFIVPLLPLIPILAMTLSLVIATHLPAEAWVRLVVLSLIGFIIYFIQCLVNAQTVSTKESDPEPEEEQESEISSPLLSESSISRRNSLE